MKKRIAILGSTGSIGTQALEVIAEHNDKFEVEVLTAQNSVDLLIAQAKQYVPNTVVIANEAHYAKISEALSNLPIKVYAGDDAIAQVVEMGSIDIVLTAMVGYSGLLPTIKAIEAGKKIALANKETLVVAGELITKLAIEKKVDIIPVDSEHSAIFQCLIGEKEACVEKIYLTASGGPFRGKDAAFLQTVTKEQALKHPNWDMGAKITIDSATMMNKGLEVIEAQWLFGLSAEQIDVIVHPQSIVHSLVQYIDGSMKAQMGLPDMKHPIQYSFAYPNRVLSKAERFNFLDYPQLSFEKADKINFPNLQLAYDALQMGGNMPCVLNAANEVVVDAFLNDRISFTHIPIIIEKTMQQIAVSQNLSYNDYVQQNIEARRIAEEISKKYK